mmetsp:Transcript_13487/g.38355  ORF Transcript_13487/g.38355 Transcript_13487/m.38355 type:complete len:234 (-) Transcript_13487:93-794(-)
MAPLGSDAALLALVVATATSGAAAFVPTFPGLSVGTASKAAPRAATALQGRSKAELDAEWEAQQEILRRRRAPVERETYFREINDRRNEETVKLQEDWGWQTRQYAKGEDPLDEWKKRRESGQIPDIEGQYGDPQEIGGIPLPMASFGVGGEFGVGGQFDNGGRFDLRLPYVDQGYEDDDADVMGKLMRMFGGGKKKEAQEPPPLAQELPPQALEPPPPPPPELPRKKNFWEV